MSPKKVTSERGISDLDGKVADEEEIIQAEVIDAEILYEDEPPKPPEEGDEERTHCLYCENLIHDQPKADRFGLVCPGEDPNATAKAVQKYLMMREFCEDQEKIDDLDVDKLAADAQEAYQGRKRSNVTHAELQADIDMRLGRLRPKMKLRENLPSDGPDFEIPHVTVPGKVPAPRGGIGGPSKRPSKILTQKQQAAERSREVAKRFSSHLESTPTMDEIPHVSGVPANQREREYDQMMFINKTNRE